VLMDVPRKKAEYTVRECAGPKRSFTLREEGVGGMRRSEGTGGVAHNFQQKGCLPGRKGAGPEVYCAMSCPSAGAPRTCTA
jgi:hypothetical protein